MPVGSRATGRSPGERGRPCRARIVVRRPECPAPFGRSTGLGARRRVPVPRTRGLEFAERLVAGGAQVGVPTTPTWHPRPAAPRPLPGRRNGRERRRQMTRTSMGCRPTWTCAPYSCRAAGFAARRWASERDVFCNPDAGARTDRRVHRHLRRGDGPCRSPACTTGPPGNARGAVRDLERFLASDAPIRLFRGGREASGARPSAAGVGPDEGPGRAPRFRGDVPGRRHAERRPGPPGGAISRRSS